MNKRRELSLTVTELKRCVPMPKPGGGERLCD